MPAEIAGVSSVRVLSIAPFTPDEIESPSLEETESFPASIPSDTLLCRVFKPSETELIPDSSFGAPCASVAAPFESVCVPVINSGQLFHP